MSQSSSKPVVVILGGGPGGCGAAFQLARSGKATAILVERQAVVGGNAGSFDWNGHRLDYGSHRLHHACDPEILRDIEQLLGEDLRSRERRGRIRLRNRWLQFPLRGTDLARRLDRGFALGMIRDMALAPVRKRMGTTDDTFASVLMAQLGPTMCHHFYFPYARKLWGHEPEQLSGIQARRRVSAASISKLIKRVIKPPGAGRFFYPRRGYGQITEAYAEAARRHGAELLLGSTVTGVTRTAGEGKCWTVTVNQGGATRDIAADYVWSTIPITLLARMVQPPPPAEVLAASREISYRAMLLVYLELDVPQFTSTDAHYFPESDVRMTRLSEPKNYFGRTEPRDRTVLCAEIPCDTGEALWTMSDAELGRVVADDMARAGLPLPRPPVAVMTRRLAQAYPVYRLGYEVPFGILDRWATELPDLLVFGRQGLFAHDNTHHALFMAYAAVDCLTENGFDDARWNGHYRPLFATHVVED